MSSSRPVCSSSRNPAEGFAVVIILFSSVVILSADTIFILSALLLIDVSVSSAIRKSSCAANLTALIILSGSSLKVASGSSGVRIIPFLISSIPPNGSSTSPGLSLLRLIARALIVKSRLFWSSSSVPGETDGLRESDEYDSFLAPTNSMSEFRYLNVAVPKVLNTVTLMSRLISRATARAIAGPSPRTTMSISLSGFTLPII